MPTLSQTEEPNQTPAEQDHIRQIHVRLTQGAYLRLILAAKRRGVGVGRVVSELATEHLPAEVAA